MEKINITKEDIVESPKEIVLDGRVIDVKKTTWKEIISPDKIGKFDNPDKEIVLIKFECLYNGVYFKGEQTFPYYEKPMSNSKMGMYLLKYGDFEPGKAIKVFYNSKSFPEIVLE
jgi:kynurenine formamidase